METLVAPISDGRNIRGGNADGSVVEIDVSSIVLMKSFQRLIRKMSTDEKRELEAALTRLAPEDLSKALEIVAQNNPNFQATAEEFVS